MKQKKQKENKTEKQNAAIDEAYGEIIDIDSAYGRDKLKELKESEEKAENEKKAASDEKASEDEGAEESKKENVSENSSDDEADDGSETSGKMASKGLKVLGVASICVAVLGFLAMGALVYFLVIKPPYIKEKSDREFEIPFVNTRTDALFASDIVLLSTPSDVDFAAIKDEVALIDANAKEHPLDIASDTDATATDADYSDGSDSDAPEDDY